LNNTQFAAILELLVPMLVQQIQEKRALTSQEAVTLLYRSELYATLEREASKLWHLSAPMLYDLLEEELTTGQITWPEEA
jgi:hypothetical protein